MLNKIKRIAIVLLALLLIIVTVGCDKKPNESNIPGEVSNVSGETGESGNNNENGTSNSTGNSVQGGSFSVPDAPSKMEYGAKGAETPLSNVYKLLAVEKKLTIGYIGGSITYGSSATKAVGGQLGNINLSYVNRISNWFKETYKGTTIETVNAGVSDTATNFGIFRLEKNLMNTSGHDMPDLVFIEFTSNDSTSLKKEKLLVQIESMIRNIWDANPYAEIVFISTQVAYKNESIKAYKEIGEKYNIPFIDVGSPLRKAKHEKWGSTKETSGKFYYTVDDLHPSHIGYGVYFDTIKPVLEEKLKFEIKDWKLYNYKANLKAPINNNLIDNPTIITADKLTVSGNAEVVNNGVDVSLYGTSLSIHNEKLTENSLKITGNATVTAKFSGTAFGFLFDILDNKSIPMRYKIDGGEWVDYTISGSYAHPQGYIKEQDLEDKEHTVTVEFLDGTNTMLGGLLVDGK